MATALPIDKQAAIVQKLREYEGTVRFATWLGERLSARADRAPSKGRHMPPTETISWRDAGKSVPRDDSTVLVNFSADDEDGEPVWLGYFSAGQWFSVDGWPLGDRVRAWAYKPKGMLG